MRTKTALRSKEHSTKDPCRITTEQNNASLPAADAASVALGEFLYQSNNLDAAEDQLTEGLELADGTTDIRLAWLPTHTSPLRTSSRQEQTQKAPLEATQDTQHPGAKRRRPFLLVVFAALSKHQVASR